MNTTTPAPARATTEATMALHTALEARLEPSARAWLDGALDAAAEAVRPGAATATQPVMPAWELRFAEAGRHCGTEDAADHARILLLYTARAEAGSTIRLYHQGTAAERRAILLALPHLGLDPSQGLPLVEDALRTNDPRLVAAAVGPYGAAHLDTHGWRHAVLKCLFTEVPVEAVDRLAERARGDAELARMLDDYARERTAAGRAVPGDLLQVRALTGEETEES